MTDGFRGDVVATVKRDLKAGEMRDGEGGFTVWGKLYPSETSLSLGGLPIGLAHHVKLKSDIPVNQLVRWQDAIKIRRQMEARFELPVAAE
jgi:predicted homoserine dehydrogenase-like protein